MVCSVPTAGALGEHPAPLLRTGGYPLTHRATRYLPHRVFIALFRGQVTVFLISLKNPLSLQKSGNPVTDGMHQFCQFLLIRCVRLNDRDLAFARRAGVQASVLDTDFKIRRICRRRI